jgi:hypothetical protein
MEAESEGEGNQQWNVCPCHHPYLKLYEREEYEELMKEDDEDYHGWEKHMHFWKYYRVCRFFDSITGFHEVRKEIAKRRYAHLY